MYEYLIIAGIDVQPFTRMDAPTAKSKGYCAPGKCMHSPICAKNAQMTYILLPV